MKMFCLIFKPNGNHGNTEKCRCIPRNANSRCVMKVVKARVISIIFRSETSLAVYVYRNSSHQSHRYLCRARGDLVAFVARCT